MFNVSDFRVPKMQQIPSESRLQTKMLSLVPLLLHRQGDPNQAGGPELQNREEGPQSEPPPIQPFQAAVPELPEGQTRDSDTGNNATTLNQDKSPLSSSIYIEVTNVQSSLELTPITGNTFKCVLILSHMCIQCALLTLKIVQL